MDKIETAKKIGEDKVFEFRRSWDIKPGKLSRESSYHPLNIETDKLMESLERVNLLNKKDVLVSELSVGQKKRVSIAKWLITDAKLYLIDEPFSALDDQGHKAVEDLIKELINRGCSFLLTGHRKSNEEYGAFHLD